MIYKRWRYAASSVLVENKLYFFGGYIGGKCSNEVFYLDLSRSFNLATPPWIDLTLNAKIPFRSCWGTVSLNNKEQIIYLFGGLNLDDLNQNVFVSSIHSFNLNSLSWNVPNIKGIKPNRRANIQSVIDNSGIMYIFGGYTGPSLGTGTTFDYNDMVILNTVELSWANNIINPPNPRDLYTATLLSSGVIVYIGLEDMNIESGTMKIIIASIGGIVVAIIIIACVFLIYRWNENRKILSPKNINEEHTLPGHINEEHTLPGEIVEKV
ncbi:13566_t:CDS:2 [Funneliformis geosporum]|uniref:13566_t:CDS:1 n=1 Tax=Funneliformis geosporum TaxID=1117311 RepID=A0A9W4SDG7_9GLOM|nr:13566_t:CDS:2 [Funneliformis geosporum]